MGIANKIKSLFTGADSKAGTGFYTFHCKQCGFTYSSHNRAKRDRAKKNHKVFVEYTNPRTKEKNILKVCHLKATSYGTRCRPDLLNACELNHIEKGV